MGCKTPLTPAIVSGIDSVLLHVQKALGRVQKTIDSADKYILRNNNRTQKRSITDSIVSTCGINESVIF
jgi:hypothetical protein